MHEATPSEISPLLSAARRLTVVVRKRSQPLLGAFGLTIAGRSLLARLDEAGPATVPELARHLLIARQVTQRLVDDLTSAGWVERHANPRSRRSHLHALTPRGRELLADVALAERDLLAGLPFGPTRDEALACLATLDRLADALGEGA